MFKNITEKAEPRVLLSTLWIFTILNYLYADFLGLYEKGFLAELIETGGVEGLEFTGTFLLVASIMMETAIVMVLFSRVLKHIYARWANIAMGLFHTLAVGGSMFVGSSPTGSYIFFGSIEMITTLYIAWYAWNWKASSSNK